jgi:Ribonuclease G/E
MAPNAEQTAYKQILMQPLNARQLRLRDRGLIVCDFIDMRNERRRDIEKPSVTPLSRPRAM